MPLAGFETFQTHQCSGEFRQQSFALRPCFLGLTLGCNLKNSQTVYIDLPVSITYIYRVINFVICNTITTLRQNERYLCFQKSGRVKAVLENHPAEEMINILFFYQII